MSSLKCKFGGAVVLVVCWCLLMVYLVEWVPAAPLVTLESEATTAAGTTTTSTSTSTARSSYQAAQVLIASDGLCLGGLVSAVNSILTHTRHDVQFYLVTTREEAAHLRSWIQSTKLHRMRYEIKALNSSGGLPRVKTRPAELFPQLGGGRLVYLDCDVIVQGDIWELFTAHIQPGHLAAFSQNCVGGPRPPRLHSYLNMDNPALSALRLDPKACPFATGVFVANLTLWRRHDVTGSVQHWLRAHKTHRILGSHPGADLLEAAMLIVLWGHVTSLDPAWHVQHVGSFSRQFVEKQAKLLHWSGRSKPWSHRVPHEDVWHRYYIPDPTAQFRPARRRV